MIPNTWLLLAEAPIKTKFEWGRIQNEYDWLIYGGILLAILGVVFAIYRRDTSELPWWLKALLPLLRAAVFVGLLAVYLQPHYRSEREEHYDSRVLLLVDTSLSMARPDAEGSSSPGQTRLQQVAAGLDDTDFIARLRKKHKVSVVPFNNTLDRARRVELSKDIPAAATDADTKESDAAEGAKPQSAEQRMMAPQWRKHLVPGGTETRLGDALEQLLREERTTPVSGVVLISDGGLNAGASVDTALELARESHIPIHTIGIGSEKKPISVRVADFNVPRRVFPGDRYTVDGAIQGQGMSGRTATVELLAREGEAAKDPLQRGRGEVVDHREVVMAGDGEVVPVHFDIVPDKLGTRTLCLRVQTPSGDLSPGEKFREREVEVSDHKTKVLLVAGGPMRDYQYLRTMLFRDRSATVDVLLQSAQSGMSQEATKILDDFPATREAMFSYDCLVAFDPNWQALRPEQVDLLFDWIDKDRGGMIAVAGPVYAGRTFEGWVQDPEMSKIRKLYPVEFNHALTSRSNVVFGGEEPWQLDLSREGLQAQYLWLGDTAEASQQAWVQSPGIYGYCPVRDKKAGATVLARFSDPRTAQSGEQPIYMAVHRYSASPVLYIGSAETWRLRRVDPALFEQLWTKLIRFASQEHLRRQSSRGSLSIDHDQYTVGSSVEIRAQLLNARMQPLTDPNVTMLVSRNGGTPKPVGMVPDPTRAGRYLTQFAVLEAGDYRLDLRLPESADEHLGQSFVGIVPRLEEENPQRNVPLLKEIAKKTDGVYYTSLTDALSGPATSAVPSLVDSLPDVTRHESIPLAPKPEDERNWLRWMLIALCGVLCFEWLVRRLAKLA